MAHYVYSRPFLCLRLSDSTPTLKMLASAVVYVALGILTLSGWWFYLAFSTDPGAETKKNTTEVQSRLLDKLENNSYLPTRIRDVTSWKNETLNPDVRKAFPLSKGPNNPGGIDRMTIDVLKSDREFTDRLKNCAKLVMLCWQWSLTKGIPCNKDLSNSDTVWETYKSPETILHMLESMKLFLDENDPIYQNLLAFALAHIPFLAQKVTSSEQSCLLQCWKNSTSSWEDLPIEYSPALAFPTQAQHSDDTIAQLRKDQQFIFNLKISAQCIMHSWGWDLQNATALSESSLDQSWSAHPDQDGFVQIMDSIKLFLGEEDLLYHSLLLFAYQSNITVSVMQAEAASTSNFFNTAAEFFGFSTEPTSTSTSTSLVSAKDFDAHVNESHINHVISETKGFAELYQMLNPLQNSNAREKWNQITRNEWINRAFPANGLERWEIAKLKEDPDFISNLKKSAIALMKAWGWDLEKGEMLTNAAWKANPNPDAIVRMLTCLSLFLPKDDPILINLENFALNQFSAFNDNALPVEKPARLEKPPVSAFEYLQREERRLTMMFEGAREASLMAGIYAKPNPGIFMVAAAEMVQILGDSADQITAKPSLCYLAFPIQDSFVSIDDQPSNLTEEEVVLLKQEPEFLANLKESARILMATWGWDLETGQPTEEALSSWESTGNIDILIRMGKSLHLLIPDDPYYAHLVAFAAQKEISSQIDESEDRMSLGLSANMSDLVDESVGLSSHSSIAEELEERVESITSETNIPETALGNLAREIRLHVGLGTLYDHFTDKVATSETSNHITTPWVREALGLKLSEDDVEELSQNHEFCQNLEVEARVLMKLLDEQSNSSVIDALVEDSPDENYQESKEMALDAQNKNLVRFANNLLVITRNSDLYQEFVTTVERFIQVSA